MIGIRTARVNVENAAMSTRIKTTDARLTAKPVHNAGNQGILREYAGKASHPTKGGATGQSSAGNGGSWRNTQQSNSNNRYTTNKKVYQIKQEEFPPKQGHPDYEAFVKYCHWIGSDACQGGEDIQDANNE